MESPLQIQSPTSRSATAKLHRSQKAAMPIPKGGLVFLFLPFLLAALLSSLAATFHSTKATSIYLWKEDASQQPRQQFTRPQLLLTKMPEVSTQLEFTPDTFPVAGVDLANADWSKALEHLGGPALEPPFALFRDFDLSSQLIGNETWVDLIRYRRDASFPSLSFYVDKVARKRWLPSTNGVLEGMETYVLEYGSELLELGSHSNHKNTSSSDPKEAAQSRAIQDLLPLHKDYAAKPTHLSCAGGVWLTKELKNGTTLVGNGKKAFREIPNFSNQMVADDLAHQLQKVQLSCGRKVPESIALQNVRPGIVVEERFTTWSDDQAGDNKGGMEFKVFTIWGRMWLAVQRPGMDGAVAIVQRNGTNLEWAGTSNPLPDWIDWPKIVALAEASGKHKDMFRTDIFVGKSSSNDNIRYAISENEIHPTEYFHVKGTKAIFDEGARLWMAGYLFGNYHIVDNNEVPQAFLEHNMLPKDFDVS